MSNRNGAVRFFGGGINSAAYWVGTTLLSASHVLNDSSVTGTTVKDALNYLSTASTAVFPFVASGLAEQDLVSYDASAATWRNRTKAAALKGSGTNSIVVGSGSFAAGTNTIVFGTSAGSANIGAENIVMGTDALDGATVALTDIVAIGKDALTATSSTNSNGSVAVGSGTLASVTTPNSSPGGLVAVGYYALNLLTTGIASTAVGYASGSRVTTGSVNTFFGYECGKAVSSSSFNTAIGANALSNAASTSNVNNMVAVGAGALSGALNGALGSVAVGYNAMAALTTGIQNAAVGYYAGAALTTGYNNTIFGYEAMAFGGSGSIGCVAIGGQTLRSASLNTSSATAIGYYCLNSLTTGTYTTGVGASALYRVTSGNNNTGLGYLAGGNVTTGSNNVFVGAECAKNTYQDISDMVGIGNGVFGAAVQNTANGSVAIGSGALSAVTTGANIAIGYLAGNTLTVGASNTIVGHDADVTANSRSGCVVLGRGASAATDDTLVIRMGNTSTKEIIITPVVDATVRAASTYLPIKVGSTQYYMPLYT